MALLTDTSRAHSGFAQRINDAVSRLANRYANYRLYRRTYEELASLSNAELDDLGISRYDIDRIARDSVYGA